MVETKVRVRRVNASGEREVVAYNNCVLDEAARLALTFLERWGMVAGIEDGEDSAGRAKLKLLSPDEIVDRAFTIAEKALAAAKARGHLIDAPDLNELNAEHDQRQDRRVQSDWDMRMRLTDVEDGLEQMRATAAELVKMQSEEQRKLLIKDDANKDPG